LPARLLDELVLLRVHGDLALDWNRVEGNWLLIKGKVKEQWGKLTDDDLNVIDGGRDQLEGKFQGRHWYAKDHKNGYRRRV
jgi:uncharacterized protein YjbJ (UPF0337 family)